ncbi:PD-(D/E)XK nuclease-like domain-containing protein [Runella slithyformis]|uniref:Putative exodeoxyribonuclease 8 PDDEXK-like domain-containing protein n=1 Tax=Runella slithyformis (strain ATCC 29530 / DSM 19594 / LMG 11500 / NCIMB 11436 / LSU 4) TaxID=761193 RepID=A0A7U3ZNC8_RUNSL|nr:PD-(D/E)XK nuclease-like domain-containing protein [Runella slithyformis]AEI50258.1 hypothetical protein Runsl_3902 [Runella slithyformis DSM 19594]
MQLLKLTDEEYFSAKRYSNSDLSELEKQMFQVQKRPLPANAFRFGSMFHHYVLDGIEPADATPKERELIEAMAEQLNNNSTFWNRWAFGQKEVTVFWEAEGLPLKCKLDLMLKNRNNTTICDLKTTTAKNIVEFYADIVRYNYHRQAAFYMDSVGATKHEIWGIQKAVPFRIFFLSNNADSDLIQDGRNRYQCLLKAVHEQQFTPAKWTQETLSCL